MFACSMYQANPENLESADRESKTQIRRLQHHASIALWAGNNENEKALADNWYLEKFDVKIVVPRYSLCSIRYGTDSDYSRYAEDYLSLYVNVIKTRSEAEDPSRPFLVGAILQC